MLSCQLPPLRAEGSKNQVLLNYANDNQKWMKDNNLPFVSKDQNPPNAPQIQPIERFWALLKNLVYEGNWVAENSKTFQRFFKQLLLIDLKFALLKKIGYQSNGNYLSFQQNFTDLSYDP